MIFVDHSRRPFLERSQCPSGHPAPCRRAIPAAEARTGHRGVHRGRPNLRQGRPPPLPRVRGPARRRPPPLRSHCIWHEIGPFFYKLQLHPQFPQISNSTNPLSCRPMYTSPVGCQVAWIRVLPATVHRSQSVPRRATVRKAPAAPAGALPGRGPLPNCFLILFLSLRMPLAIPISSKVNFPKFNRIT